MTRKGHIRESEDGLFADDEMIPHLTNEQLQYQKSESLDNESLTNNKINDISRIYAHPIHALTDVIKRDGYEIKWVTFKENETITASYIQEYSFKGYHLVPRDRVPNAPILSDFGLNELSNKYVIYKDAIAMEVATEIDKNNKKIQAEAAHRAIKDLRGVRTESGREIGGGLLDLDGSGRVANF